MNYKQTLNLPVTKFSMRGNLAKFEPKVLKNWDECRLYHLIRSVKKKSKSVFFIHDGPPYANGSIHIGHAVNKILKDIIIKSKGFMGYDIFYIPGWDCHGLPIELKVEALISKLDYKVSQKKFRVLCRQYANTQIKQQKKDFIRLGVLGDWDNSYSTMEFSSEANIIRCLSKVIDQGYLYRGLKPIYWCIECCSVLSEAEVEYNSNHISSSIYLLFSASNSEFFAVRFGCINFKHAIFLIVWSTTPWTLPGNRALAVHPDYDYCLSKIGGKYYVFASSLLKNVLSCFSYTDYKIISVAKGKDLEFSLFKHPFMSFEVPIVLADYVLSTVGTGVVHIAPGHGVDDHIIALKYDLEIFNVVDSNGYYKPDILLCLNNLKLYEASDIIIILLKKFEKLLYFEKLQHSYPYCWRHKVPVIFRTTFQWFINLNHNGLREKCLEKVDNMFWIPISGKSIIKSMIADRPDWCISRQRVWGVPITVFLHKDNKTLHPHTVELMEKIACYVDKSGIQAWWDLGFEDLLGRDDALKYNKVYDVLDVWFDSGSTFFSSPMICSEFKNYIPDMYLEGSDQYRGWFMSSLLLSVIIAGSMPCKTVLSHGFSVDFQGRKMSKSIGNVISPQDIINKFGADILRLWVASSDYTKEIVFSDENIQYIAVAYRRIRNTTRFILGNLYDFEPEKDIVCPEDMVILDRWIISRALCVQSAIILDYKNYNFHRIVQRVIYFCSIELGSFYLDIIKDRQYVIQKNSLSRRSSQSALYHIVEALVRWVAPILSFTADEIWRNIPGKRSLYVFTEEWYSGLFSMDESHVMNEGYWNIFFEIRNRVNKVIEEKRNIGCIGSSLEASITIYARSELVTLLKKLGNELHFGFLTSSVKIVDCNFFSKTVDSNECIFEGLKIVLEKAKGKKCLRCWHYTLDVGLNDSYPDICFRCIENVSGKGEIRRFI